MLSLLVGKARFVCFASVVGGLGLNLDSAVLEPRAEKKKKNDSLFLVA